MAKANGHEGIQATAYGTYSGWDKAKNKPIISDVKYFNAECVNPPAGVKAMDGSVPDSKARSAIRCLHENRSRPRQNRGRLFSGSSIVNIAIAILLDGLSYSAWLFLVSVGMTLVFGVLRILNIAHGALYAGGAYIAAFAVGFLISNGASLPWQLVALTLLPLIVGLAVGYVIEQSILKPMINEDGVTLLLATYAIFLVLEDALKLISGGGSFYASQPRSAMGQLTIVGLPYATYDLVLIFVAIALAVLGAWILTATQIGQLVVAVVEDREIARR